MVKRQLANGGEAERRGCAGLRRDKFSLFHGSQDNLDSQWEGTFKKPLTTCSSGSVEGLWGDRSSLIKYFELERPDKRLQQVLTEFFP